MTDAFAALGLPSGADERAVERAYTRRLPMVRPDADPAGFQALHEAYRAALDAARARPGAGGPAEAREPDVRVEAPGEPGPPAAPCGPFSIDLGAFLPALLARAAAGETDGLRAWIDEATSDWPAAARAVVAPLLLVSLGARGAALTPAQFDAVAAAFDFEGVRVDPAQLARVRAQVEARAARPSGRLSPAWARMRWIPVLCGGARTFLLDARARVTRFRGRGRDPPSRRPSGAEPP